MKLIYRPTEERDLAECLRLTQQATPPIYPAERLLHAWHVLRHQGAFNSAVMEDQERPAGRRLVHFGASVFVTDQFLREVRANPRPGLATVIVEMVLADRSPVLEASAIRHGNAGSGLNVFVLHTHLAADLRPEEHQAVTARGPDTFFLVHQGYCIKEVLMQMPDTLHKQFLIASGFRRRDESASLFGLTDAEAQAVPGTYAARLFACERPRLRLRTRDQQLLQRALLGETDTGIAAALQLAPDTIKARWRAIYERVAELAPELLPDGTADMKRGAEKRRHLLHYLRHHPEELRPLSHEE